MYPQCYFKMCMSMYVALTSYGNQADKHHIPNSFFRFSFIFMKNNSHLNILVFNILQESLMLIGVYGISAK